MAAEFGPIAAKLGDLYERRYSVERMLGLLTGDIRSLCWEPAPEHKGGADIDIEHGDGTLEHVQLKRQNSADARWTVANLAGEGVLEAAQRYAQHPNKRFTFVSSDPVPHLKDICDQATRADESATQFVARRVQSNKERSRAFDDLLSRWALDRREERDVASAVMRLRSMRFVVLDRGADALRHLHLLVQLSLSGEPAQVLPLLEAFLDTHLGRSISQQDLLEHLAGLGVRPRDLVRDPSLPSALFALRERFRQSLRERCINDQQLARSQVSEALERILSPSPPRVILVHGRPGAGKSHVLLGVVDGLIDSVPVLPLSLKDQPPHGTVLSYGRDLGLDASPVAALRATAGQQVAVLLVDQLDALRYTTPQAAAMWSTCRDLLREAAADPHTVLVVACRTFDLQNDPNIREWRGTFQQRPADLLEIEVDVLPAVDVASILRAREVDYSTLPPRLQALLRHPNTLDAWCRLATRGQDRRDFSTQTELLGRLIQVLRREAVRDHGVTDGDVTAVLERLRARLEKSGQLTAPATRFDDLPTALHACCTVGLLVWSGRAVSFPHQSYFEHLVARAALKDSGGTADGILAWATSDQSLARRDRVRQLLFLLHDESAPVAAQVMGDLLRNDGVRFHIKQLVLGVLREIDPTAEDIDLVVQLLVIADWAAHLRERILWRSPAWFDELHTRGAWLRLLSDPNPDARAEWLNVVCSVMPERPAQVEALLTPLLAEPGGAALVGRMLPAHDLVHDPPSIAAERERRVGLGEWFVHPFAIEELAAHDPERAVRLLAAYVRGEVRRQVGSPESSSSADSEVAFRENIPRAVRAHAGMAWPLLTPLLISAEHADDEYGQGYEPQPTRDAEDSFLSYLSACARGRPLFPLLINWVADAVTGLAELDGAQLRAALDDPRLDASHGLAVAVALGLERSPVTVADAALAWLCASPTRWALEPLLSLTGSLPERGALAPEIIRRHAPHCSDETLAALERQIMSYFPRYEKKYRTLGQSQHALLHAIPAERCSPAARARIAEWDRKFGAPRTQAAMGGGWVRSPIPRARLECVPDRQWLAIMSRDWRGRRWRQVGPDELAEASHLHFANDIAECTKRTQGASYAWHCASRPQRPRCTWPDSGVRWASKAPTSTRAPKTTSTP